MTLKFRIKRLLGEANLRRARIVIDAAQAFARTFERTEKRFPLPPDRIAPALRKLGVREGDTLLVHSSSDALRNALDAPSGEPDRGPLAHAVDVLGALRSTVGVAGTLAMPTDAMPRNVYQFARAGKVFDAQSMPTHRGLLAEIFRRSPDAHRSVHPWYNLTAQGPGAASLVADHARSTPYAMDRYSPWWKLVERDAKVALLGVDYEVNSLIHLIEYMHPAEFPEPVFLERPLRLRYTKTDGAVGEIDVKLHCNRYRAGDPTWAQRRLQEAYGVFRETKLGAAPLIVFEARRLYESMLQDMRDGRTWYDAIYAR